MPSLKLNRKTGLRLKILSMKQYYYHLFTQFYYIGAVHITKGTVYCVFFSEGGQRYGVTLYCKFGYFLYLFSPK